MSLVGVAGVNCRQLNRTVLAGGQVGVAGIDSPRIHSKTVVGIAGNPGTPMRPLFRSVSDRPAVKAASLGDTVQATAWSRAVYLSDWTYLVCPDRQGGLRWRRGFEELFSRENRRLALYLDSGSFRIFTGTAPAWATFDNYLAAIRLIQPDAVMAFDVVGDQAAGARNCALMLLAGLGCPVIPVWQIGPTYDRRLSARDNARRALKDPMLQYYAARSPMLALGGMVQGSCPREERHLYLDELCRHLPAHRLWALGQASHVVVNGLGQYGRLDQVSVDGSWWIHHARCESIAVMEKGLLRAVRLEGTGMRSFFTLAEMMLCNLRSVLGAYSGAWEFPAPAPEAAALPGDTEAARALKAALAPEQLTFRHILGGAATGTEG